MSETLTVISTIVQIIAVIVTAIATGWLAVLTNKYVRLTDKMVQSAESVREPFVDIELDMPDHLWRFAFVNCGGTAARNIRFRVDKDCELIQLHGASAKGIAALHPIKEGISYLPAGQRYLYGAGIVPRDFPPGEASALRLTVSYSNDAGRVFSRTIHYDLRQTNDLLFESFRNTHHAVAEAIRDAERSQAQHRRPSVLLHMGTSPCPYCRKRISCAATKCPHCQEWIKKPDQPEPSIEHASEAAIKDDPNPIAPS
jgi:hypothetical protein